MGPGPRNTFGSPVCLLACLLVIRDWDPLPPPPLSQAAPDLHTARARAQHGSSSTLEVGIAPQPGEVGRSRCAWQWGGGLEQTDGQFHSGQTGVPCDPHDVLSRRFAGRTRSKARASGSPGGRAVLLLTLSGCAPRIRCAPRLVRVPLVVGIYTARGSVWTRW